MPTQDDLRTNYKDSQYLGKKKYKMIENDDGTVSFDDVTDYTVKGDDFRAEDVNNINYVVKTLAIEDGAPVNVTGFNYKQYVSDFTQYTGDGTFASYYATYQSYIPPGLVNFSLFAARAGNFYNASIYPFVIPANGIEAVRPDETGDYFMLPAGSPYGIYIMGFYKEGLLEEMKQDIPSIQAVIGRSIGDLSPFAIGKCEIFDTDGEEIISFECGYYVGFNQQYPDMIDIYMGAFDDINVELNGRTIGQAGFGIYYNRPLQYYESVE